MAVDEVAMAVGAAWKAPLERKQASTALRSQMTTTSSKQGGINAQGIAGSMSASGADRARATENGKASAFEELLVNIVV